MSLRYYLSRFRTYLTKSQNKYKINQIAPLEYLDSIDDFHNNHLISAKELALIPQFGGTCWFNAILMVLLYSEGIRKVIYNEAFQWQSENPEELRRNKFKRFIIYMLKYNYKNPEKINKLFKNRRVKPELLLLSYLEYYSGKKDNYDKETLKTKLKQCDFGYYSSFINDVIYQLFEHTTFNIIYSFKHTSYHTKSYLGQPLEPSKPNPKILIVYNSDLYTYEAMEYIWSLNETFSARIQIPDNNTENKKIENYKKEFIFNGSKYKLNACLINNYNSSCYNPSHVIAGITYNNRGYIYNGWNISNDAENYEHCPLFEKDWINDTYNKAGTRGFCLPQTDCDGLKKINPNDLCFDFSIKNKGFRVLIYVKIDEEPLQTLQSIKTTEIEYTSASAKKLITIYHQLEDKTIEDLKQILITNCGYFIDTINQFNVQSLNRYRLLFFLMSGEKLQTEITTENLKQFFIGLIELYLKDNKRISLPLFDDYILYNNITYEFLKKRLLWGNKYDFLMKLDIYDYLILYDLITKTYYLRKEYNRTLFLCGLIETYVLEPSINFIKEIQLFKDDVIIRKLLDLSKEHRLELQNLSSINTLSPDLIPILDNKLFNIGIIDDDKRNNYLKILLNLTPIALFNLIIEPQTGGNRSIKKKLKSYKK